MDLSGSEQFATRGRFTEADDRLPGWMRTEPLAPHNTVFTVPDSELDEVFNRALKALGR